MIRLRPPGFRLRQGFGVQVRLSILRSHAVA